MASLVYIYENNPLGAQLLTAVAQIREGVGFLAKRDGTRSQTIAVSAAEFANTFGVTTQEGAQALNDRWAAITGGDYSGLDEFMDTILRASSQSV
jgi:hypothetical protein